MEVESERSAADRSGSSLRVKEVTGCSQESLVSLAPPTAGGGAGGRRAAQHTCLFLRETVEVCDKGRRVCLFPNQ